MAFRIKSIAVMACCSAVLLSGCTNESGAIDPGDSEDGQSEGLTPPASRNFDEQVEAMVTWDDTCAEVDLEPVLGEFANAESIETRSSEPQAGPEQGAAWSGSCKADIHIAGTGVSHDVRMTVTAFATNVQAFEYYHDFGIMTAERFSDAAIDQTFGLGDDSVWQASRVTAQETPTVKSEQRVVATAALLGEFYTVELLVRFGPDDVVRTGCEPGGSQDCAMTASHMAEFLATSGYLEDLHVGIEAAIDGASP